MNENNPTTQRTESKQYSPHFKDQTLARAEKIGVREAGARSMSGEPINKTLPSKIELASHHIFLHAIRV